MSKRRARRIRGKETAAVIVGLMKRNHKLDLENRELMGRCGNLLYRLQDAHSAALERIARQFYEDEFKQETFKRALHKAAVQLGDAFGREIANQLLQERPKFVLAQRLMDHILAMAHQQVQIVAEPSFSRGPDLDPLQAHYQEVVSTIRIQIPHLETAFRVQT